MKTLQHVATLVLALSSKRLEEEIFQLRLKESIPWLLLPDAIRMYIGPHQASHFEETLDGNSRSWMEFPKPELLKKISKENVKHLMRYHVAATPKCVIGEKTFLDEFDTHNYAHEYYHELRMHILQDIVLDKCLRKKLVNVEQRFEDRFVAWHDHSFILNGNELRNQIEAFENIGFLYLVGKIYQKTGILLNQQWFEKNVHKTLLGSAYPKELAENTYQCMRIPMDIEERMNNLDFSINQEDETRVKIAADLEKVLDEMYAEAYIQTVKEII